VNPSVVVVLALVVVLLRVTDDEDERLIVTDYQRSANVSIAVEGPQMRSGLA
jgi:hypothetical protein